MWHLIVEPQGYYTKTTNIPTSGHPNINTRKRVYSILSHLFYQSPSTLLKPTTALALLIFSTFNRYRPVSLFREHHLLALIRNPYNSNNCLTQSPLVSYIQNLSGHEDSSNCRPGNSRRSFSSELLAWSAHPQLHHCRYVRAVLDIVRATSRYRSHHDMHR